jgi:hypothetical protein
VVHGTLANRAGTLGKFYLRLQEMKNRNKTRALYAAVALLIAVVAWLLLNPRERVVRERVVKTIPVEVRRRQPVVREREFRSAPIKRYKPGILQQMGILKSQAGEILPLYGREVDGRRDRYHYYTTTASSGGSFSLPVKDSQGRDCMDDIGCGELYGGSEKVAVTGKDDEYDVEIYRTNDFFSQQ